MIQIESREQIESIIENNAVVVMDFYADWCGPCKMLLPVLERVSVELEDAVFCKINVDTLSDLAKERAVRSIPTLKLIKDGVEVSTKVGAKNETELIEWVKGVMG